MISVLMMTLVLGTLIEKLEIFHFETRIITDTIPWAETKLKEQRGWSEDGLDTLDQ